MTPNLDNLRDEVNKLKSLLDDPHPGLAAWQRAYRVQMKKIVDFYMTPGNEKEVKNC